MLYDARVISIADGLRIPEDEILHDHKTDTPSLHELGLARRPHRWREMRELHKDFFNNFLSEVTEVEENILGVLQLPGIETVRNSILTETEQDITGESKFKYTAMMDRLLKQEFDEWIEELIGTDLAKKEITAMEATYPYWMLRAFSIGLEKQFDKIQRLRKQSDDPTIDNQYLRAIITQGGKRIKTKLGREYWPLVQKYLRQMSKEGQNPLIVARWIHKKVGEGQAWYWNRLTRSESGLALNGAFNASVRKYGIPYERWSAASDACDICSYFDGKIWKVGSGPSPIEATHPFCNIGSTKIYTCDGWVRIDQVKLGDLVLTHNGKFKKVTQLHKHIERDIPFVELIYTNPPTIKKHGANTNIKITTNHPVLLNGKWIEAGKVKVGNQIRILATRCIVCGKLLPYSAWRTTRGDRMKYCSTQCRLKLMKKWTDRPHSETIEIRKKISDYKKINNPMHNIRTRNKMITTLKPIWNSESHKIKLKKVRNNFIKNNPGFIKRVLDEWKTKNPEHYYKTKKQQGRSLSKYYKEHPNINKERQLKWRKENPQRAKQIDSETSKRNKKQIAERNILLEGFLKWRREHPELYKQSLSKGAKTLAKNKWISYPQRCMYELIKEHYGNAILNMEIETNYGFRWGDVVLPTHNIILEYDGQHWHQDEAKELQRDLELQFAGYTVLHFDKTNWKTAPKQIERLLANHAGSWEFIDMIICDVIKYTKKHVALYNLSVDQDESYIAKGFVVHNCLCDRDPVYFPEQFVELPWTRPSPYDQPYTPEELEGLI